MNERIRQLVEQAGYTKGQHDEYGRQTVMSEFNKEKFAELIVRECAEVSKNYAGGSMPLSIALAIKKHFGVEE
jgi:hypothetical protein